MLSMATNGHRCMKDQSIRAVPSHKKRSLQSACIVDVDKSAGSIALHMGLQRLILEVERYFMLVEQVWQNQMRGTTITKAVEELDQVEDGYGSERTICCSYDLLRCGMAWPMPESLAFFTGYDACQRSVLKKMHVMFP